MLIAVCGGSRSRPVRFVDDNKIRAMLKEVLSLPVALHEVDTDHLNRIVAIDAARSRREYAFRAG